MDTKLTVVPDAEFEALRRLSDYNDPNNGTLNRIEGDTFYAVFRRSLWDELERSRARIDAEDPIGFRSNDT
jgi:hypothetical protein